MTALQASATAPRRARHRGLCAGQERGAGRRQDPQAVVERDARSAPSPKAIAAYQAAAHDLRGLSGRRSDGFARSDRHAPIGLDPSRIVCGAGSDDLLNLLARAYLARRRRGDLHHARLPDLSDRDARRGRQARGRAGERITPPMSMRSSTAVTPKTKIVFLANPNNPTGTYLPFDEVKRLHAGLPPHVLLVLDAAYAEYVGATTTKPASSSSRPPRMS